MRIFSKELAIVMTLGLAACSSSGSGDDSSSDGQTPDATTAAAYEGYEEVEDGIDSGALTVMDSMPTGTASMSGHMGLDDVDEDGELDAVGELSVDADFDAATVTGTASNFGLYDDNDNLASDIDGSLDIDGTITGVTMSADATGTLSEDSDDIDVALTMDGTFYEDSADRLYVEGDVGGTVDGEQQDGAFYLSED